MTIIGTAFVHIKPDSKGFEGEAEQGVLGSVGGLASKAKLLMGGAIAGAVTKGVMEFASFETRMNEVFTLLPGISGPAMDKMTGQVKGFATEFGVLPEKVVPALYQSLSAGVPQDNVFAFLETAQKAAKGGVTDLTTAVDGITSVVNAYGKETMSASQASDLMFTAVRLGKTNFEQLSSSLFQVNPIAASLGVKFGDVTAALAAMTAQGVPTSVATTQLRQAFVELSKDGTKTSDLFKDLAGKTFKDFIAGGGNTQQALQLLEGHAKKTGVGINDLFGSVEAGSAALALTGGNTAAFSDAIKQMGESTGATDAAFQTMNKGIGPLIDKVKAFASVALLNLGHAASTAGLALIEKLTPAFTTVKDVVVGLFDLFVRGDFTGALARAFNVEEDSPLVARLFAIRDGMITLIGFVRDQLIPLIQDVMGTAFRIGADAIGLAVTAISTLVGWFQNPVFQVLAGILVVTLIPALISLGVNAALAGAQTVFWFVAMKAQAISSAVTTVAQMVLMGAKWIWMGITALASAAQVAAAWLIALGPVALVVAAIVAAAVLIVRNWDTIKDAAGAMVRAVSGFLGDLIGTVSRIPGQILAALSGLWDMLYEAGRSIIRGLVAGITSMAGAVGDAVRGVLQRARNLLPFSDAKEGPFKDLTLSGRRIPETIAKGIMSSSALADALGDASAAARARLDALNQSQALALGGRASALPLESTSSSTAAASIPELRQLVSLLTLLIQQGGLGTWNVSGADPFAVAAAVSRQMDWGAGG